MPVSVCSKEATYAAALLSTSCSERASSSAIMTRSFLHRRQLLVDAHLELAKSPVRGGSVDAQVPSLLVQLAHFDRDELSRLRSLAVQHVDRRADDARVGDELSR